MRASPKTQEGVGMRSREEFDGEKKKAARRRPATIRRTRILRSILVFHTHKGLAIVVLCAHCIGIGKKSLSDSRVQRSIR